VIDFFADDSNDSTFLSTHSNPIYDFSITLDGTGSSPVLSAFFTYDPSRLSIPGAPTNPSLYQSYADFLLRALLSDTTNVSLTNVGTFGETLTINNLVTLFSGTYTAAISTPGAEDPNYSGHVDYTFGVVAGVSTVSEPSTLILVGMVAFGLLTQMLMKTQRLARFRPARLSRHPA
jgi:hypothetical protein